MGQFGNHPIVQPVQRQFQCDRLQEMDRQEAIKQEQHETMVPQRYPLGSPVQYGQHAMQHMQPQGNSLLQAHMIAQQEQAEASMAAAAQLQAEEQFHAERAALEAQQKIVGHQSNVLQAAPDQQAYKGAEGARAMAHLSWDQIAIKAQERRRTDPDADGYGKAVAPFRTPQHRVGSTASIPLRPMPSTWDPYLANDTVSAVQEMKVESDEFIPARNSVDNLFQMNSPSSTVAVSRCSTPQRSVSVPSGSTVASPVSTTEMPEEPRTGAVCQSYLGEPEHSARPHRRLVVTKVPDQTEGSMRGAAPGEGQAIAKTPKVDELSTKARTECQEDPVVDQGVSQIVA